MNDAEVTRKKQVGTTYPYLIFGWIKNLKVNK